MIDRLAGWCLWNMLKMHQGKCHAEYI